MLTLLTVNDEASGARDGDASAQAPAKKGRSNLAVRLGTVFLLGTPLLLLLFFGPAWGWALLIIAATGVSAHELLGMTHPHDRVARFVGALLTKLLALAFYLSGADPRLLVTGLLAVVIVSGLVPLVRLGDISSAALRVFGGMATPLYVGLLLTTLALLRTEQGDAGPAWVFLTLQIAWMGDTGGYTFGRLWGKTKLYEAVSPKKTREGLLGSIVFSTLAALLASFTYLKELPPLDAAVLGFLGAILGQSGDLIESLLKRSTGVKDSGSILPGHGGLLDRIDALLVVSPLVYLYTVWM